MADSNSKELSFTKQVAKNSAIFIPSDIKRIYGIHEGDYVEMRIVRVINEKDYRKGSVN